MKMSKYVLIPVHKCIQRETSTKILPIFLFDPFREKCS